MRKIIGTKINKGGLMGESVGDTIYPTFYIDIKHLPEAKNWEIGETYEVTLQLRQTGINIRRHEGKKEDYGSADFEIIGIEPHTTAKKERYPRVKKE